MQYYPPRGQEIIASAMALQLRQDDYVVTTYRGIHDQIAKGVPLKSLFAEFAGRASGTCKGKGGSMHVTHPNSGVMVTTGIVGAGLPIANGLALASQLLADGRITVCNFGDGASNIGAFHEALNMASLWKLPVIFLCQNNRWAEHTRFENGMTCANVADRAVAYGMAAMTVDGNDPDLMWEAAGRAVARARSGEGPTLLEAMTFRLLGHNFGDSRDYMPAEEISALDAEDPLPRLRRHILEHGIGSESDLHDLQTRHQSQIEEAFEFALSSPFPEPADSMNDVYATAVAQ